MINLKLFMQYFTVLLMKRRPKSFFINKLIGVRYMVTQCCNRLDFKVDVKTFMRSLTNALPLRFFNGK